MTKYAKKKVLITKQCKCQLKCSENAEINFGSRYFATKFQMYLHIFHEHANAYVSGS